MEELGFVSLWAGTANSIDEFSQYHDISFDENGDTLLSDFEKNFDIEYYNEDFKEAEFYEKPSRDIRTLLTGASYDEKVISEFVNFIGEEFESDINVILLLYNFKYIESDSILVNEENANVVLRFIGTVKYT